MKYRTFTILMLLALLLVSAVPLAAQDDVTECEAGFRLFDNEYLATDPLCIPENPERIVAAWPFNITALLRADAPIVGMIDQEFVIGQFPEWEAELAEITDLGRPLNLELMLTLEPDLIIAPSFLAENPDTLTAVAPTVLFEWESTHIWREVTELMFDAAGEREAFEAIVTEQDSRIAELSGLLGDGTRQELSLVNMYYGNVYLYTQYSPGGMIAEELGFARPEAQLLPVTPDELADNPDAYPNFEPYIQTVSLELIDRAAGDFIIVFGDFNTDDEAQTYFDTATESPLWQTLDAVQTGNVFVSTVNYAGGDIGNAHFMLDDIAEAFGVAEELSPNPYEIKAPLPEMTTEESSN
jgi:iron complex transport system substrate-binding protein